MAHSVTDHPARASAQTARSFPQWVREAFEPADSVESAHRWAAELARTHYENFPVLSLLLPRRFRQDFCNLYAFCRVADDAADELADPHASLAQLQSLRDLILNCPSAGLDTRLGAVLAETIARHQLPQQPFFDLIDAFEQDQRVNRYETFEQLLGYCRRSANPVGRLVLYICGYREAHYHNLSDWTCTALQLANMWQDVRRDLTDNGRIYLPRESMEHFGVTEQQLREGQCNENYRELIRFEVVRTQAMFERGRELLPLLRPAVRWHVALFGEAGLAVLAAIRHQHYDTLTHRPVITLRQRTALIYKVMAIAAGGLFRKEGAIT